MSKRQGTTRAQAAAILAALLGMTAGESTAAENPAAPATSSEDAGAATLPPVVVTATRVEQPIEQVGSAVTVITGEELRRREIRFVADALQEVPGVTVPRSGTRGKTASIFLRGSNANQTLVLLDGVRVNDLVGGAFDFSSLTTDNVERIEVIRGPQSTLYGSQAMGGVVNIITRRGRGPFTASAGAAAGNYHTNALDASIFGNAERFSASVEASRYATDNRFENDAFDVLTASGRIDARLAERLSARLTFRRSDANTGAPGQALIALAPDDRQENTTTVLGLTLEHRTASLWTQRLTAARSDSELRFTSGGSTDITESVSRSVEWVHAIAEGRPVSLVLGGEYRSEDGEGFTIDRTIVTRAAFAQAQLLALEERVSLQAGVRYDDGTQLDGEATPRVSGALLVPETATRLHASWGKGIKAPTLLDLFFPGFSNPDLDPERVTGWDAGVEQRVLGDRATADVTFFRNDFTDLIVFSPTTFQIDNVGQAHTYGVESSLQLRPVAWLDLGAVHTYLVAINDDTRDQLLRRPRHQGSAQVTVRPIARATATLSALYVGDRRDSTFQPGSTTRAQGAYTRVDLSARYRIPDVAGFRALELFGRVENLLDRDYEEVAGFPALGINVLAGVRGTF